MKLLAFLTPILCELLAFAFFFWADWRVGTGYAIIFLGELCTKENWRIIKYSAEAARQSMRDKEDKP